MTVAARLQRETFRTSRLLDFCSQRELVKQIGHPVEQWPLVILKELADNALDAAEDAEIAPAIQIGVCNNQIVVTDNGPGIQPETVADILDFAVRVSSREAYASPTRGAQGNALKTILAMGYVLDREETDSDADAVGVTTIETKGLTHRIEFRVDHINNQPKITHTIAPSAINVGTKITIDWPTNVQLLDWAHERFKRLAESYVWFNPHLSLRVLWHDSEFINVSATNPNWEKWGPRNPTSPHWYDETRFQRYMAAHVARDRDLGHRRTVREFVTEFRGLCGTAVQRKVLEEAGCSHQSLAQFFGVDRVNRAGLARLLTSMRKHSKPVTPKHLGVIGREHFKQRFLAAGGNEATFKYQRRNGMTAERVPYIVEFAFGLHQSALTQGGTAATRKIITGANWSVGIHNPFRTFGSTGEGLEATLGTVRANAGSPVICALHLASAHIQYADRGKSSIILTDNAEQPND